MREELLSVGIDIGTTTTQLVVSRLRLENKSNPFSVPEIAITNKEIIYRSHIHFTPLISETLIDADLVAQIVEQEYRRAKIEPEQVQTGAVIITGETARKENAREVLHALSQFAGDFVVATAGPDLESILAGQGAGSCDYSKDNFVNVIHFDIGGGTSNIAFYALGELEFTDCLNIGGRLMKLSETGEILYLSPALNEWLPSHGFRLGQAIDLAQLQPLVSAMVDGLKAVIPNGVTKLSFSGGVADCMWNPPENWLEFGDMGVVLGQAIRTQLEGDGYELICGKETIRATVIGAGAYSVSVSGSTIFYRDIEFPLKNMPILKLTTAEEGLGGEELGQAISAKLNWYGDDQGLTQLVLGLEGERSPSYSRVEALAEGIRLGLTPLLEQGYLPLVVVKADMAKALGHALGFDRPNLCLDGIAVSNGDYIDIGAPVAFGQVVPVVVKTLAFDNQ